MEQTFSLPEGRIIRQNCFLKFLATGKSKTLEKSKSGKKVYSTLLSSMFFAAQICELKNNVYNKSSAHSWHKTTPEQQNKCNLNSWGA